MSLKSGNLMNIAESPRLRRKGFHVRDARYLTRIANQTVSGLKGGSQDFGETPDSLRKALSSIERGAIDKTQELLIGISLLRSLDLSLINFLSDAVVRIVNILSDPRSASLSHSIVEKIVEVLPFALTVILHKEPQKFQQKHLDDIVRKLRDFKRTINKKVLGGPELYFYIKISIYLVHNIPEATDWDQETLTALGYMSALLKWVLLPTSVPIDTIGSVFLRFGHYLDRRFWSKDIKQFFEIQKHIMILHTYNDGEEYNRALKILKDFSKTKRNYTLSVLIMALKNFIIGRNDQRLLDMFSEFFLEICLDKKIRPIALRACFELSLINYEFNQKVDRMLSEKESIFNKDSNLLVRYLLTERYDVTRFLSDIEQNWKNCIGLDPSAYKNMTDRFRDAFEDYKDNYINLEVAESPYDNAPVEQIDSKIDYFLAHHDFNICLVLGDPGCGKTTFCRRLKYKMLIEKHDFLPVYINPLDANNYPTELVDHAFGRYNIDKHSRIIRNRKILFIIDAYDELRQRIKIIANNGILASYPQSKIIIVCNTYLLPNKKYFMRESRFYSNGLNEIYALYIQRLNYEQIGKYMARSPDALIELIRHDSKLRDLVSNTFLLYFYAKDEKIKEYVKEDRSIYHYIERLVTQMLKRSEKKRRDNPFVVRRPITGKLLKLFEKKCQKLAEKYLIEKEFCLELLYKKDIYEIVDGIPLTVQKFDKKEKPVCFKFLNDTFFSYFAANAIIGILSDEEILGSSFLSEIDITEQSDMLYFLSEMKLRTKYKKSLYEAILMSKNDIKYQTLAANAITILNRCGFSFQGSDLSQIRIPGANLSGGNFREADLSYSYLLNVNITNCNLIRTNFSNCALINPVLDSPTVSYPSQEHSLAVTSVFASEKHIATASLDGTAKLWDLNNGSTVWTSKQYPYAINAVLIVSKYVIIGSESPSIQYLSKNSGSERSEIPAHESAITCLCVTSDEEFFASGSKDCVIKVWKVEDRTEIQRFVGHTQAIKSISFNPNNEEIASVSYDQTFKIWNTYSGNVAYSQTFEGYYAVSVKYASTDDLLAVATSNNKIILYDAARKEKKMSKNIQANTICFRPGDRSIACGGGDSRTFLLDIENSRIELDLIWERGPINTIDFSPDGQKIICGNANGKLIVWDMNSPPKEDYHRLADEFSHDGSLLAFGCSRNIVHVYNTNSGEMLCTLNGNAGRTTVVELSYDNKYLASASEDFKLNVWELATQQLVFSRVLDDIVDLKFSKNSDIVIVFNSQGESSKWSISTGETSTEKESKEYVFFGSSKSENLPISWVSYSSLQAYGAVKKHLMTSRAIYDRLN